MKKTDKKALKTEKQLVVLQKDDTPAIKVFLSSDKNAMSHSLQIARVFDRSHKDVLKTIKDIECSEEFNGRNFSPVKYLDKKGEVRTYYKITKNGFAYLVLGFAGKKAAKFKEDYINAFDLMADKIRATEQKELADTKKKLTTAQRDVKNIGNDLLKTNDNLQKVIGANAELHQRINMPKPLEQHLNDTMGKVSDALEGIKLQIVQVTHKDSMLMPVQRVNTYKAMIASLRMAISNIQMVHHIEGLKNSPSFAGDEKSIEMLNFVVHSMNQ